MTLDEFGKTLVEKSSDAEVEEFGRRTLLHGTPFVFKGRESDYFSFKSRICTELGVHHTEIFIVGSAKLGFSPQKKTDFSLNSDVDVAIVSPDLWEKVSDVGVELEYLRRSFRVTLHRRQEENYIDYLRYLAIGWIRPDLIPYTFPIKEFKQRWFDFFESISFNKSEVGNYKVSAGIFKSQQRLERYTAHSLLGVRRRLRMSNEAAS